MRRGASSIVCLAALILLSAGFARAADSDFARDGDSDVAQAGDSEWLAQDEQAEVLPEATFACDEGCACDAAAAGAGVPLNVFVPNLAPGFQFTGGVLLLKPGADNLGWSTITTYLPIQSPQWDVQNINPGYQPGFTVGGRYVFPCSGTDIQTNWEHLRTSDSSSVAVSDPTTQWISPFNQTGPSTSEFYNQIGIFYLKSAEAQLSFAYDMVNIDAGKTVNLGANTQVRLFTGLSWVRLQQQLISTFYNNTSIDPAPPATAIPDPDLQYVSLTNITSYTGIGPRLGLSATQNVFHGLTLVGQLSGAVLAGSMQPAQYRFKGVFDDAIDSEAITSRPVNQVVYATDAKLGLGYNRFWANRFHLSFESGFKAALFIDPFATYETSTNVLPLNIGSLSTNSMRHTPSNFTLNGWYATASVQW